MKDTTTALYNGKEYSAGFKDDKIIILRSTDENDIKKGFVICEPFKFRDVEKDIVCFKYVSRKEIDGIYDIVTTANYQGYSFDVIGDDGDKILLCTMTLDYRICQNLGMECVDKGIYQKWINKREAKIKVKKEML